MHLVRKLDELLNGTTMYRLILYVLSVWATLGIAFSFTGVLHYSWTGLVVSLGLAIACCYLANLVLSWVWNVATNSESWLITALILFSIMPPATTTSRMAGIIVASCAAMAGKFIIAVYGKHIFNPAAFGAVVAGMLGLSYAGWWIGSAVLLPFVVIGGLLVVRKVRRFTLVVSFIATSLVTMLIVGAFQGRAPAEVITAAFTSWPLVFFACIMLTEPSTLPPRRFLQVIYAVFVGVLFSLQWRWGVLATTPHMVLLAGNLFSYAVSPKRRMLVRLEEKRQMGPNIYDYVFKPVKKINFQPGQYMEWTLPHRHADDRGNRRTFSIASSPTEPMVHIGVKFYQPSSSFKRALYSMESGQELWVGHVAGDFVLPKDPTVPMIWIAGGIGITPFRSMVQHLVDTKQQRDIVLFYAITDPQEQAYADVLAAGKAYGLRVVPVLTAKEAPKSWKGLTGFLTPEIIANEAPDYARRHFYLSGPNGMVAAYRAMARRMHVSRRHIVTDYFSGY
jgi:ferredoxin-NADP reductase